MRMVLISLLAVVSVSCTPAGEETREEKNVFVSEDLGISMEVPVVKESDVESYIIAAFCLPSSDNFSANVNVQKQKYADSIGTYDKLSTGQFEKSKMTIVKRELDRNTVLYEYKGELQGVATHWYAKAIKRGDYVFLTTATALEKHWKDQKAKLMKAVDSFTVED